MRPTDRVFAEIPDKELVRLIKLELHQRAVGTSRGFSFMPFYEGALRWLATQEKA